MKLMKKAALGAAVAFATLVSAAPASAVALIYGIDVSGNLVTIRSDAPGVIASSKEISGVIGSGILGIDFRPSNGLLYALGGDKVLYTINTATGAATALNGGTPLAIVTASNYGFDFNPAADRLRVIAQNGASYRINVDTGGLTTDSSLSGTSPRVTAAGYANNVPGAASTTLYGIDFATDSLVRIAPPNAGTVNLVGPLGVNVNGDASFDISSLGETFLISERNLYSVNLTTGAASSIGTTAVGLRSIAVVAVPEPATWAMMIGGFGMVGGAMRRRRRSAGQPAVA